MVLAERRKFAMNFYVHEQHNTYKLGRCKYEKRGVLIQERVYKRGNIHEGGEVRGSMRKKIVPFKLFFTWS